MADYRTRRAATAHVVSCREDAAQHGLYTQYIEEFAADPEPFCGTRLTSLRQIEGPRTPRYEAGKVLVLLRVLFLTSLSPALKLQRTPLFAPVLPLIQFLPTLGGPWSSRLPAQRLKKFKGCFVRSPAQGKVPHRP